MRYPYIVGAVVVATVVLVSILVYNGKIKVPETTKPETVPNNED